MKGNHTYQIRRRTAHRDNEASNLYTDTDGAYTFSPNETRCPTWGRPVSAAEPWASRYASFMLGPWIGCKSRRSTMRMGKLALGMFAQDTWKITRKLTFDYGLRYDYQTYMKETGGRYAQFAPNGAQPDGGRAAGRGGVRGQGSRPPEHAAIAVCQKLSLGLRAAVGGGLSDHSKTVFRAE